jgi:hypothetical protein
MPPGHVVDALEGSAITIPTGRLSVKERYVAAEGFAVLSMVNVRVLLDPIGTEAGAKALVNPGLDVDTVRSSVAGPLLPASDVRSPEILV